MTVVGVEAEKGKSVAIMPRWRAGEFEVRSTKAEKMLRSSRHP